MLLLLCDDIALRFFLPELHDNTEKPDIVQTCLAACMAGPTPPAAITDSVQSPEAACVKRSLLMCAPGASMMTACLQDADHSMYDYFHRTLAQPGLFWKPRPSRPSEGVADPTAEDAGRCVALNLQTLPTLPCAGGPSCALALVMQWRASHVLASMNLTVRPVGHEMQQ